MKKYHLGGPWGCWSLGRQRKVESVSGKEWHGWTLKAWRSLGNIGNSWSQDWIAVDTVWSGGAGRRGPLVVKGDQRGLRVPCWEWHIVIYVLTTPCSMPGPTRTGGHIFGLRHDFPKCWTTLPKLPNEIKYHFLSVYMITAFPENSTDHPNSCLYCIDQK